ncbi:YcnI family protein [Arenibaculum sp.]|uniref:YcnI family copper-binding membrane protein n=1 Tax=Arenibaculum sp. TaxID=2865862 RepID=UPI002E112623|nr:YcnI family protein [Arenibaculum sp.]
MTRMTLAALAAAIAAVPGTGAAHVTLQAGEAPAGGYYRAVLQVGHGCEGSPTREIRVRVPDGMVSAKPMPKPGWEVEAVRGPLATPYVSHGRTITEGVTEIRWSGGPLLDEHYDEFVFRARLPETPGAVLHVPVIQTCVQGEHRWIEIPAQGQDPDALAEPAPSLRLTDPAR